MVRKSRALLGLTGLLSPGMVLALGLGELSLQSYLNEPLRAEVALLESAGLNPDQVKIRLAGLEDFERAGIERAYFLTSLKFEVELTPNGNGRLLISSPQPVREPFLDFVIEARWPNGRLLREYTVLLDPPVFTGTRTEDERSGGVVASRSGSDSGGGAAPSPTSGPTPTPGATSRTPREYDAGADDQPAVGGKYLVQRNETLWAIASQARPSGASVQQTMLDIQRLNPEAFIGNNVNRLKAGYVLRLPTTDDISNHNFDEAVAAIALQESRWKAAKEGRRLDASEEAESSGVTSSDETGGRLQIAGAEEDPARGYGNLEQEVTSSLENLDRAQRDNADMRARMDAMEEQVETLQRLLSLKDEQIATLQNTLRDGGELDEELAGTIVAPGEETTAGDVDETTGETPADAGAAKPAPGEQPAPAPAPVQEEQGLLASLMDYMLYIALGVVLLLVLVVMALRKRFSSDDADADYESDLPMRHVDGDDEFADVELGDDGLIVDEFQDESGVVEELAGEPQSFSSEEDMYAARFESGDALAEADIYIAYGRYPQAVDVLKSAIAVEPITTELRLKLMEACAEMAEREEFQHQYADLQLIGDEAALAKSRDYLEIVDGGEMWLQDLPNPSITMAEIDAARARMAEGALKTGPIVEFVADEFVADEEEDVAEEDVAEEGDDTLGQLADGFDELDDGLDLDTTVAFGSTDDSQLPAADDGEKVDLDLDLEIEEIRAPGPQAGPAANTDALLSDLDELDLDTSVEAGREELSLDMDSGSDLGIGELDLDQPEPAVAAADETSTFGEMELVGLGDEQSSSAAFGSSAEPELELADELDGKLLTEFGELTIEGEEPTGNEQPDLDQSLGELTDSLAAGSAAADFTMEDAAAEEGEDEGELVFASNGDETATRLDLARAYMDMGDQDGARSILEEVVQAGDDGQKQEAQSLLDSIA